MNIIIQILQNNGHPWNVKTCFNTKTKYKFPTVNLRSYKHIITFNGHSSLIRKVKNLFQNTNLNKAFRTSNITFNLLKPNRKSKTNFSRLFGRLKKWAKQTTEIRYKNIKDTSKQMIHSHTNVWPHIWNHRINRMSTKRITHELFNKLRQPALQAWAYSNQWKNYELIYNIQLQHACM
jgi:hypothetical protein